MFAGSTFALPGRRAPLRAVAGLIVAAASWGTACAAQGAENSPGRRALLRFDPLSNPRPPYLVETPEREAKAGCVYSHFCERLKRQVWAIRRADGGFSHALGEGSTQPGPAMDIRGTDEEKKKKLEETDPDLLRHLQREGGTAFFRLMGDNTWRLVDPPATHSTIYDLETQRRWEWVNGRYIPVSSAPFAYLWRVVDGKYVPADGEVLLDGCPSCGDQ